MNQAITIRPARPGDTPALTDILLDTGWFANLEEQGPEGARQRVAGRLAACLADGSHLPLVAEDEGGRVVGYASVHWLPYLFKPGLEAYVSELFVHPERRGRGVGGQLLASLEAEARRRGCCQLMLVNNRQRDSFQRGFYAKRGWQERDMANFAFPL